MTRKKILSSPGTGKRGTPLIEDGPELSLLNLRRIDIGLVRREYTRTRDIARKRIERLKSSGFLTPREYQNMLTQIPRIRDMVAPDAVYSALVGTYRFLASAESTIAGRRLRRRISVQNLQLMGVDYATEENAGELFRFIDDLAAVAIEHGKKGSPTAIAFLAEVRPRTMVLEDIKGEYEEWIGESGDLF